MAAHVSAGMPEGSKGVGLRSTVFLNAWVRTPLPASNVVK